MSEEAATGSPHRGLAHWIAFVASGGLSFVVDSGVMEGLVDFGGWRAQRARLISIPCAMVVGWLAHRTFTFKVSAPPSFAEFLRFVGAASTASFINYAIFWGLLAVWPDMHRMVALVIATAFATCASYLGFRFGTFRAPRS